MMKIHNIYFLHTLWCPLQPYEILTYDSTCMW